MPNGRPPPPTPQPLSKAVCTYVSNGLAQTAGKIASGTAAPSDLQNAASQLMLVANNIQETNTDSVFKQAAAQVNPSTIDWNNSPAITQTWNLMKQYNPSLTLDQTKTFLTSGQEQAPEILEKFATLGMVLPTNNVAKLLLARANQISASPHEGHLNFIKENLFHGTNQGHLQRVYLYNNDGFFSRPGGGGSFCNAFSFYSDAYGVGYFAFSTAVAVDVLEAIAPAVPVLGVIGGILAAVDLIYCQ